MTPKFQRPLRSAEEVAAHNEQRLVEAVVRKLEGLPAPWPQQLTDTSVAGIAKYRIREIDVVTDVGWGDSKAISLAKHHVRNAVSAIESHADNWKFNTLNAGPGGWNILSVPVVKMIKGLRARVDPVVHVARAEFDPDGYLGHQYDEIEAAHLQEIAAIKQRCDQMRNGATKGARSKIREYERGQLQDVLSSMANAVRGWEEDLNAACKEVGLG